MQVFRKYVSDNGSGTEKSHVRGLGPNNELSFVIGL